MRAAMQPPLLTGLAAAAVVLGLPAAPAAAQDLVVTSMADSGPGSLREAIEQANADATADRILFNLPGPVGAKTITVSSELPAVVEPLTIDGYTQPGSRPDTSAEGSNAQLTVVVTGGGEVARGLHLEGEGGVVRGLGPARLHGRRGAHRHRGPARRELGVGQHGGGKLHRTRPWRDVGDRERGRRRTH